MRALAAALLVAVLPLAVAAPAAAQEAGRPRTGQPAADVLASEDVWGNPTFIGGLTNAGPTAHSVW